MVRPDEARQENAVKQQGLGIEEVGEQAARHETAGAAICGDRSCRRTQGLCSEHEQVEDAAPSQGRHRDRRVRQAAGEAEHGQDEVDAEPGGDSQNAQDAGKAAASGRDHREVTHVGARRELDQHHGQQKAGQHRRVDRPGRGAGQ